MNNLPAIIKENEELEIVENNQRVKSQNFLTLLHKKPSQQEIRQNKLANNSKYLPISFLEMTLDEMFFGLWETTNFSYQNIANEIVGSLELRYFHPTFKTWITRIGAGAVMIQMEKGAEIIDISKKYKNTLTKDFPHLKAECFRNACLSIGKAFGRDLNREFEDQYQPLIKAEQVTEEKIVDHLTKKLISELSKYNGTDKEQIKQECRIAKEKGQLNIDFAQKIAKKLGVQL
ncbi:MAG: hypothetical protein KJ941_00070 [Bacteroidetes bacterium]|nr:hypothetical protein [Bacteroidota bacterium]